MTVCKELGYIGAKFMSGGSYFQPITELQNALDSFQFALTHLECDENDELITNCFGSNDVHEMCDVGTAAGVICD